MSIVAQEPILFNDDCEQYQAGKTRPLKMKLCTAKGPMPIILLFRKTKVMKPISVTGAANSVVVKDKG